LAVTPFATLLATESDHPVSFDRQGNEVRWEQFLRAVAGVSARLVERREQKWAIDIADSFDYAVALFACWNSGKTAVLALPHMLDVGAPAQQLDGIIAAGERDAGPLPLIATNDIEPAPLTDPRLDPAAEVVLFTSGSTGEPARVRRYIHNIEAELRVLESLFGSNIGAGRIYSTVSHSHVYGMLFRLLWPIVTRRPFASYDFEYPENLLGGASGGNALITSPALLKRIGHLAQPAAHPWAMVFSSGGLLPEAAAKDAMRLLGCCPVEVLGSTETSGVAWRRQQERGAAERWRALPKVRIRQDDEGFLEIESPFVGLAGWHRMGDRVRLETSDSFELLGRGDHIVKIEEKRVSLAEIERKATQHAWVNDAAAVALGDDARQQIGLVVQLTAAGNLQLMEQGRRHVSETIRRALRGSLEAVAVPRKFRFVDAIPVNPQGKRLPEVMRDLFERPAPVIEPRIVGQSVVPPRGVFKLVVPPDLFYLEGHFPGRPVLPGVVQLHWAIGLARRYLDPGPAFKGIEGLKFHRIIEPDVPVTLTLELAIPAGKLHFRYESELGVHSQGRILFG
jgi:acyl-coenzyme A synthetase/AMP-(fatty) acid ligase